MTIKTVTLHSKANGSDKIYILTLEEMGDGYIVNYTHGRREVGPFTSGTKTPDPTDKKRPKAVTLEAAEKIFAEVEKDKRTGKSKYGDFIEDGAPQPLAPVPTNGTRSDVGCMELTAIMDATAAIRVLRDKEFLIEEKHDGIRFQLDVTLVQATGYNRTGGTRAVPSVVESEALQIAKAVGAFMVDGELVGERYHAFDMLEFKGVDCRNEPLEKRKALLRKFFDLAGPVKAISIVEFATAEEEKIALLEKLNRLKREGIVIKKRSSRYQAGRSKEWFKFKFVDMASVIVTKHNERRSVTMSLYHEGQLREVGHLPIPTNKEIPPVGSIVEVRYRKADPKSLNLIETVFLHVREDVKEKDCDTSQLKFTTKAA